jgi:hypothetical protein
MSKFSLSESEYLRASTVRGQNILKIKRTNPSPMTRAMEIHVYVFILLVIPEYRT